MHLLGCFMFIKWYIYCDHAWEIVFEVILKEHSIGRQRIFVFNWGWGWGMLWVVDFEMLLKEKKYLFVI
jgi:hypothetical protein